MKETTFEVPGIIVGKQRPRFARRGNKITTYTPAKTENAETKIALFAKQSGVELTESAVSLDIRLFFQVPKSWPNKKREHALEGKIPHTTRPDIDNCIKTIKDALKGIAYGDDSQVIEIHAIKQYSTKSKTIIQIKANQ
jgi:Holliday junction resolvase RusA-like endonuclease